MHTPTVRESLKSALDLCAELERRGCQILTAHCHQGGIQITVDSPPPGTFEAYGYAPQYGARRLTTCVAQCGGARVEWQEGPTSRRLSIRDRLTWDGAPSTLRAGGR
jgi:hypothetical protein